MIAPPQGAEYLFFQCSTCARNRCGTPRTVEGQVVGDELGQVANLNNRMRHGESNGEEQSLVTSPPSIPTAAISEVVLFNYFML